MLKQCYRLSRPVVSHPASADGTLRKKEINENVIKHKEKVLRER